MTGSIQNWQFYNSLQTKEKNQTECSQNKIQYEKVMHARKDTSFIS